MIVYVSHSWQAKHADAHIEGGTATEGARPDDVTKDVLGFRGHGFTFSLPCS